MVFVPTLATTWTHRVSVIYKTRPGYESGNRCSFNRTLDVSYSSLVLELWWRISIWRNSAGLKARANSSSVLV